MSLRDSVGLGKPRRHGRRLVALDARLPGRLLVALRNVTDGGLRLGLDVRLAFGLATPRRDDEAGAAFHDLLELVVCIGTRGVLVAELDRAIEQALLNLVEHLD